MSSPGDEQGPDGSAAGPTDDEFDGGGAGPTADPGALDDAPGHVGAEEGNDVRGESTPSRAEWRRNEPRAEPSGGGHRDEDGGWQVFLYDAASSILAVLVVGAYLFTISGVWPPLVAVKSESMVPNMQVNDLVFVMEADRFPGEKAHVGTGVVTARTGREVDYRQFGGYGDVIVYTRNGQDEQVPIIHRAMFWVNESENWYDKADDASVRGASACETDDDPDTDTGLENCPAPHAGFVTKGDANGNYDQATGLSGPVRPEWVVGTAEVRIPGLGWIRLQS